jgi:hypothetical protein
LPSFRIDLDKTYPNFKLTTAKDFKRICSTHGCYFSFSIDMTIIDDKKVTIKGPFQARVKYIITP